MRVGIDIGALTAGRTGVGAYCHSLVQQLIEVVPPGTLKGFSACLHPLDLGALDGRLPHRHIPLPTRAMYALWRNLGAPRVDKLLGGVDIFHATNYVLPPVKRARRIVTIYDVAFLVEPAWCSPKIVGPFAQGIRRFVREADAVLTCSEATKRDLVSLANADPDRVVVAPGAVAEDFRPHPREEAADYLAERYGIKKPFILFVGTIEPRKNVAGLVRAFARLANDLPHALVLVGGAGWRMMPTLVACAESGAPDRIHFTGYVPHQDLARLYSAAEVFAFPSHYEGFGLPVLEAMACGCPVVTSNTSSLPEVAGSAALLVPPADDEAIEAALRRVLEDEGERTRLVQAGYEQVRRFSWHQAAEITWKLYRSLA